MAFDFQVPPGTKAIPNIQAQTYSTGQGSRLGFVVFTLEGQRMKARDFDFVIDGPPNFFGCGQNSKGCYTREGFDGMVKAYRELGKTVHVHEDHYPVFAVIEPLKRVQPATAFDISKLPLASESIKNPTGSPFFSREHGCYVKVVA